MKNIILSINITDYNKMLDCFMDIVKDASNDVSDIVIYLPHISLKDFKDIVSFSKLINNSFKQVKTHFLLEESDMEILFGDLIDRFKDLNCRFVSKTDGLTIGGNNFNYILLSGMIPSEVEELTMNLYKIKFDENLNLEKRCETNYYFAVDNLNDYKYVSDISEDFKCLSANKWEKMYVNNNYIYMQQNAEKVKK